jgi:hypothetical protein
MATEGGPRTLGEKAARQLATTTKTTPQMTLISPRWLVRLLEWVNTEAGTYRVNKVKGPGPVEVACGLHEDRELPEDYVPYEEKPREYSLSAISTVIGVQTRVSDLFSRPHDQVQQQLRLAIEDIKERQESELINNLDYGLLNSVDKNMVVKPRNSSPTPDDFDELIAKVWKEPAFFLAHPRAIAAFGRECTRRGVPPATVSMFGAQFLTWRGIPIVPSDKIDIVPEKGEQPKHPLVWPTGKTKILLLRVGQARQGVVGLVQPGMPGEQTPGLTVRFMGINRNAVANYLVSLYCSLAVLTEDALGVLEDVEIGKYHEYK